MIKSRTLDCGVRMIMEEIPYVQSVAIGIWVRAGSVDESKKNSGISHYIEHMMFKGTDKRSAKAIAEDVDKIGGQINAFTGKEATCYYMKTLSTNADKASEILLDMFLNSNFDKTELKKEKQVICEEIKMNIDSPEDDAHDTICELVFKGNPLSKSIIGTPTSLAGISRNMIMEYMSKEYTKDSIVVSIAGKFDEDVICKLFEGRLAELNPSKEEKRYEEQPYEPRYKVKVKDIEQTHLCLGTKGISLDDERYYAFVLLNNIMGGSMSSRLFQNIREEKGLAYSVYSMAGCFSEMGYYNIYAGVSHDKIRAVVEGIKDELAILKKTGVTPEELSTAKEQMKGGFIFSQENVNGRMSSIGKNLTILGKVYTPEEIISGLDTVTMDQVKEASKLIYDIENYCAVAVTNHKFDLKKVMLS